MSTTIKIMLLAIVLLLAWNIHAKAELETSEPTQRYAMRTLIRGVQPAPQLLQKDDGHYRKNGVAVAVHQPHFFAHPGDSVAMAREYITSHADKLGLDSTALANLEVTWQRPGDDFSVVRFRQNLEGLPVYGSDIAISVAPNGKVIYVANHSVEVAPLAAAKTAMLDQAQALAVARGYLGVQTLQVRRTEPMVYADASGSHRVWRLGVAGRGVSGWELLVDMQNGQVLRAEDKKRYAGSYVAGTAGEVFLSDPLSWTRHSYGDPGYSDNNNANSLQLDNALELRAFPEATLENGKYSLRSRYAACTDFDEPKDNACPLQSGRVFSYKRNSLYFDAVNAFFNIDTYMRYVNITLKIPVVPYQYQGGAQYDPHGEDGAEGSHYDDIDGTLTFGQGGVDDAQDADVAVHELGHGIHDWITHGNASNWEGLGEGIGDYLAAAYSHDIDRWLPLDKAYYWVFNWDGHNEFWAGRVTNWNLDHTYNASDFFNMDIHTVGQYWSSCNLVARRAMGGQAMDKALLKGLSMINDLATQPIAAQAVVNAADAMNYSRSQLAALDNAYNKSCNYKVTVPQYN